MIVTQAMGDEGATPKPRDYRESVARLTQASMAYNAKMCQRETRRARKLACWMAGLLLLTVAFIAAAIATAPAMPTAFVLANFGLMSLAAAIMAWMFYSEARSQARGYANERPLSGMFAMIAVKIVREAKAEEQRRAEGSRPPTADAPE